MSRGRFSDALREAREHAGFSIRGAAEALEVAVSSIQRWEAGDVVPRADEMLRAADAYNVGIETLYGRVPAGIQASLVGEAMDIAGRLSEIAARLDRAARGGSTASSGVPYPATRDAAAMASTVVELRTKTPKPRGARKRQRTPKKQEKQA